MLTRISLLELLLFSEEQNSQQVDFVVYVQNHLIVLHHIIKIKITSVMAILTEIIFLFQCFVLESPHLTSILSLLLHLLHKITRKIYSQVILTNPMVNKPKIYFYNQNYAVPMFIPFFSAHFLYSSCQMDSHLFIQEEPWQQALLQSLSLQLTRLSHQTVWKVRTLGLLSAQERVLNC